MHPVGGEPIYRRLADAAEKFVGGGADTGDAEMTKPAPKNKRSKAAVPSAATHSGRGKAIRARICPTFSMSASLRQKVNAGIVVLRR